MYAYFKPDRSPQDVSDLTVGELMRIYVESGKSVRLELLDCLDKPTAVLFIIPPYERPKCQCQSSEQSRL